MLEPIFWLAGKPENFLDHNQLERPSGSCDQFLLSKKIACSPSKFADLPFEAIVCFFPWSSTEMATSISRLRFLHKVTKSRIVHGCMSGEEYQENARLLTGILPLNKRLMRFFQCPKFTNETTACLPILTKLETTTSGCLVA